MRNDGGISTFIANRRLVQIDLPEQFQGVENPFPWMLKSGSAQEKKFFETRVIEYQRAVLPGTKFVGHSKPVVSERDCGLGFQKE